MNVLSLNPSGSTPGRINFAGCFCEGKETGQWRHIDHWKRVRKCVTSEGKGGYKQDPKTFISPAYTSASSNREHWH